MGGSGFFEKAKAHKDQQSRSLISPREQRTRRLSKARDKGERERGGYQYANVIKYYVHRDESETDRQNETSRGRQKCERTASLNQSLTFPAP
jgi:hypothetical protein